MMMPFFPLWNKMLETHARHKIKFASVIHFIKIDEMNRMSFEVMKASRLGKKKLVNQT